jgi:hypothetical protein
MVKPFTIIAGAGLMLFIVGGILHSAVGAWLDVEEPLFFLIAVVAAPVVAAVGLIGGVVALIAEWRTGRRPPR